METTTIVFMVLLLGILWGGFSALLINSMRAEKRRAESGGDDRGR